MSMHGKAFLVTHPRRREQDYVSCDTAHVVRDIIQTTRDCGWSVCIQLVNYVGNEALPINTSIGKLLEMLPPVALAKVKRID